MKIYSIIVEYDETKIRLVSALSELGQFITKQLGLHEPIHFTAAGEGWKATLIERAKH